MSTSFIRVKLHFSEPGEGGVPGRLTESFKEIERVLGRGDEAADAARRASDLDPDYFLAQFILS